ncbi:peptidyl-prolyl cis-trans isomerase [Candidatus Zixiibacteriota bacterium]
MKKIVICLILALGAFAISYLIGGCGKSEGNTVAVINGYEVTETEFNDYYTRLNMTFPSAEEEFNKKRELLDSVIVSRLLVQAAYEKNIDKSSELARVILSNKNKFLLDILFQRDIAPYIEPTDAELKDFHNKLEFKYRASHILVENLDTANALLDRIKVGENFDQLAFDYSIDPSAKRNKGDLGYFVWGSMVDSFQEAILKMEPGELSPPVKSQFGYHLIKLVDKLPNDNRRSFEMMQDDITNQVKRRKTMSTMEEFMKNLKERYPVVIEKPTCDYLMHKRENLYPPQLLKTLPRNDFDLNVLDRDEKELVFATLEGNQMTILEYLTAIKNIPQTIRPDLDDYDSLATVIFEMKKEEVLALEAVRQGYDTDHEYLEKMRLFKELNMAEVMRNDSLPEPLPPDEDEIRQYYEEHQDEFTTPDKVHVYEILLSDEITAKKLVRDIKSLEAFKEEAEKMTERPGFRSKQGDLGHIERTWYPEIFDLAIKTPLGGVAGPVVTNQKYSIFYVVDKVAEQTKDFLGVKRSIVDRIINQRRGDVFRAWVDDQKKKSQIEIKDDALWATINTEQYAIPDTTSN